MTPVQAEKIARRKLSLLQLPQELGNVSRACRIVGYSRQQFYEIRRTFQLHGADGLIDRLPGARGPHPNRVAAPVEEAILDRLLHHVHIIHIDGRRHRLREVDGLLRPPKPSPAHGDDINTA